MLKKENLNSQYVINAIKETKNIENILNDEDIIEYDEGGEITPWIIQEVVEYIDGNSFLIKQDVDKLTRDYNHDYLYPCSNRECKRNNVVFATSDELDIHNSEVHLVQYKDAQCPICNKNLANIDKLKNHMELRHTPKLFTCDNCGRCFRSKDNLRLHMTHHRKYYTVECRACHKTYKSIQSLRYHLRQHFEHHQCEACGMVFEHKKLLLGHVAAKHKQELQVQCRFCTRTFARPDVRDVHEKDIHKNGEVLSYFKCTECDQEFDLREELTNHKILNHFSGVIHTCSECGKNFKKKSLLDLHMFVHREKSFQCDVCLTYFTFLTGLNKHKKKNRCKGPPNLKMEEKLSKEDLAIIAKQQLDEITVNPKKSEVETFINFEARKRKSLTQNQTKRPMLAKKKVSEKSLPIIIEAQTLAQKSSKPSPPYELDKQPVIVRNLTEAEIAQQEGVTSSRGRIIKRKNPVVIVQQRYSKVAKKNPSYQCDCCNIKFETKTLLTSHINSIKSTGINKHICTTCDVMFVSSSLLKSHNSTFHKVTPPNKEKKFECDQCGKKYSSNHLLNLHKKSHLNLKEYACKFDECSFRTNSPYDLNNHMKRMHSTLRPFPCNLCMKSFKRRCELKTHTDTVHTDLKTYVKCPMCETIVLEKGLTSHLINRHSEKAQYKPYVCNICGKAERYEKNLKRHYEAVHEPKDRGVTYQCPDCPEKFYRRRDMTAHSFVHFQGTVQVCDVCGNKYKTKKELTNHEYTHRPVEFPCPICDMVFQTKSGRGKHLRKHNMAGKDLENFPKKFRGKINETVVAIVTDDPVPEEEIYEEYEVLDEEEWMNV